jgi:hypothetical protein
MTAVRLGLAVLLVAVILAGCGNLSSSAAFSQAQSCQAVGGSYDAGGRCNVGLP